MAEAQQVNPFLAGLKCRCPRCGRGALFDGFLKPAARCANCGLDYSAEDAGDGPAVFVMFLVGAIVVPLGLALELLVAPPLWAHFLLWAPLTVALSMAFLRPFKGVLIALQFHHKAAEARLEE